MAALEGKVAPVTGSGTLVGGFMVTKAVVPPMRASGGGSIIHIGSAIGTAAVADFAPYIASKAGLHQLAKAAAVELVGDGIRVNVVAPGTIDTQIGQEIPEFRHACLYLASDHARYVTGTALAVDGGWTAS
ncbi:MAG: SDR family oxidoreductase [Candidatus Rokubacteria bacterium]|nr:SDR family oxidoreductase [Candidatus Rokubacteria bacterium]